MVLIKPVHTLYLTKYSENKGRITLRQKANHYKGLPNEQCQQTSTHTPGKYREQKLMNSTPHALKASLFHYTFRWTNHHHFALPHIPIVLHFQLE